MENSTANPQRKPWINWLLFIGTALIIFLLGLLASSVIERRSETKAYFQKTIEIPDWEPRNEVWGQNYPRQYETYYSTLDTTFHSAHGGSATIDYLEKYPELVVMWAGYAFSRDYAQGRGHYYAIDDIRKTLRTDVPQPATCWTCKSPDVPRMMEKMGVAEFYKGTWQEMGSEVVNNIGCQDCHDPKTMNLCITRPALVEAMAARGVDVEKASHQEMRSLVCAQCHVEYYFYGDDKYLTFPWKKGFSADEMEQYYDSVQHVDWVHALSKTPMLKAQHPDYELYRTGVHADRGVACADCHMPYQRDGGMKFTNHKIGSPLENIAGSCQVCHRESEEKLRENVYSRQEKVSELRRITEKLLARVHIETKAALDAGATEAEIAPIHQLIRHAQWRWDWVAASNGMGFHSPIECLRVLGTSIDKSQEARVELARLFAKYNVPQPLQIPDISTKEKAQAFIGLNMPELRAKKQVFMETVVPQWIKESTVRQSKM